MTSSTSSSLHSALSPPKQEKAARILSACQDGDIQRLTALATSTHGLVTDDLRRLAWPLLLGCAKENSSSPPWTDLPPHRDEHQVALDVDRAFVYYPPNDGDKQVSLRKRRLSHLILSVLRAHPSLCYFQGFHDIAQVVLLVLCSGSGSGSSPTASTALARLSLLRIRDFMLSSLDPALAQLALLRPLLAAADPVLYAHLPQTQPSFALAGTITMFAHNIQDYGDIARLFDFFLASHAAMPIYFFAAVVLSRREEMLEIEREDEDIMHAVLGRLPQPFDIEFHVARAAELYEQLPLENLPGWIWWAISSASVLKASPTVGELVGVTEDEAERLLLRQEGELRWRQAYERLTVEVKRTRRRLWIYRRYGYYGMALVVGLYAVWYGRFESRFANFSPLINFLKRIGHVLR